MLPDERAAGRIGRDRTKKLTETERVWHKIVKRSGNRSVREAKRCHSHPDFLRWVAVIDDEWNEPSRVDYQLAQIAYMLWIIFCCLTGSKVKKELEDFVLKFDIHRERKKPEKDDEMTAREVNRKIERLEPLEPLDSRKQEKENILALFACLGLTDDPDSKENIDLTKPRPGKA